MVGAFINRKLFRERAPRAAPHRGRYMSCTSIVYIMESIFESKSLPSISSYSKVDTQRALLKFSGMITES